jgi:hypothetical protein
MEIRPLDANNDHTTVAELEICIANLDRAIFALQMDTTNEEKNAPYLAQMYELEQYYAKDLRALKKQKDIVGDF